MTSKAQASQEKKDKSKIIKMKSFVPQKKLSRKWKTHRMGENISANHISGKGPVFIIYWTLTI